MNIKKILILSITTASLLSTGLITNNVSASSNKNTTLTSYPKSMRGKWYTGNGDTIKITKHTMNQPGYGKQYLHKFTDAKHNVLNPSKKTAHWTFATRTSDKFYGVNKGYNKKWLNVDNWNAQSINGIFYNVSKIDGKQVLTESEGAGLSVNKQFYRNQNTANKLKNKKYSKFNYLY